MLINSSSSYKRIIICTLLLLNIVFLFSQKKVENYLSLEGQARFDSLEAMSAAYWEAQDSVSAYQHIQVIRNYAQKSHNQALTIFSDYLQALYLDRGSQQNNAFAGKLYRKVLQSLPILNLKDCPRFEADVWHRMGYHLYRIEDKKEEASTYLLKADLVYRRIGYDKIIFAAGRLGVLGAYYLLASENETAEKCFKEGLQYIDKEPSMYECNNLLTKMGIILKRAKKFEAACEYLRRVSHYVRQPRDSVWLGVAAGMMAYNMLKSQNFEAAEPLAFQDLAYTMRFNGKDTSALISSYSTICIIEGGKKQAKEVAFYFEKAKYLLDNCHSLGLVPKMNLYWSRMAADTLLGDYESAFRHLYISSERKKEFDKKNVEDKAKEFAIKYDSQKNKLSAELAKEQVQNARFVIALVSLLLVLALIGGYFLYYRQRNKKNLLAQKLLTEQKEAERLAALDALKSRFFSNVTHEFRTPLTLILEPARQLVQQLGGTTHQQNAIIIENNSKRLLELVNQLLDLAKLESGSMKVDAYTGDVLWFIQPIYESFLNMAMQTNRRFTWQHPPQIPAFTFDKDKVEKIIQNLLANAFKFSEDNAKILFSTTIIDNQFRIVVEDTGIGMSQDTLNQLFSRFYQADNSSTRKREGTGIGLALVKELVALMQGNIEVKSELGKGSIFTVNLPIPEKIALEMPLIAHQQIFLQTPEKITLPENHYVDEDNIVLLVEDNDDMLLFIQSMLQTQGYQVIVAKNGAEGIEKAYEYTPDLIISDVMMPEKDGYELTDILKNDIRTSHIPIVLLTAKSSLDSKLKGLQIGADEYIGKPFNSEELLLRVQKLIQLRSLLQAKYSPISPEKGELSSVMENEEIGMALSELDKVFLSNLGQHIENNLDNEDLNVEYFIDNFFLSRSQLHRKMIALTQQSIMEYVRHYRMGKAKELLLSKKYNVNEVASRVGFPNAKHFATTFKKHFGIRPSEV